MALAFIVYFSLMAILVASWSVPARRAVLGYAPTARAATQAAVASIVIFTLMIGLRYNVGGDFFGYIDYYRFTTLSDRPGDVVFEPGFLLLIQFLKFFHLPDQSIIVAGSFIQILLLSLWLRKHPQISPFVAFTFVALLLLDVDNIIRQGIAFFAVLLAVSSINDRRWWGFLAWILFACSFHRSALIMLPLGALIFRMKILRESNQLIALAVFYLAAGLFSVYIIGLFQLISPIFGYSGYSDVSRADLAFGKGPSSSLNLGIYLWPLIDASVIYYSRKMDKHYDTMNYRLYHNLFLIAALLQPIANVWDFLPFARALFYFVGMRTICVAFLLHYCLVESRKPRDIVLGAGIIIVLLMWLVVAVSRGAAWSSPYQFS